MLIIVLVWCGYRNFTVVVLALIASGCHTEAKLCMIYLLC